MHRSRIQWKDLSKPARMGIVSLAVVQITLLVTALVDIKRRPGYKIKGKKIWWVLISFIDILGPAAYFMFGRKNVDRTPDAS